MSQIAPLQTNNTLYIMKILSLFNSYVALVRRTRSIYIASTRNEVISEALADLQ